MTKLLQLNKLISLLLFFLILLFYTGNLYSAEDIWKKEEEKKAEIKQELLEATEKADVEISKRAAESEKAILEMRKGALKAVEEVANDTAQAILAKVMPSLNDEKTIKKAVSDRMKE